MVLSVLVASCVHAPAPPQVAPPCVAPPAARVAAPAEPPAPAHAEPPARTLAGTYWVRRRRMQGEGFSPRTSSGEPVVIERYGSTRCEPLVLRASDAPRWVSLDASVSLRVRSVDGAWAVDAPLVALPWRRTLLEGVCAARWTTTPTDDPGALDTSAGVLFTERARCEAAPSSYHQRCVDDRCDWDDPRARPFTFDRCEATVAQLRGRAAELEVATHAAMVRTLSSWEALRARGGRLYEPRAERCDVVTVTPSGQTALLTRVYREGEVTTTERERYRFEPMFARATLLTRSSWRRLPHGEGSTAGMGGVVDVQMVLGDGMILLGQRQLFTRADRCMRSAHAHSCRSATASVVAT